MTNVLKRLERLERTLSPAPRSDPNADMKRLALQNVSTEDLLVLLKMSEPGK